MRRCPHGSRGETFPKFLSPCTIHQEIPVPPPLSARLSVYFNRSPQDLALTGRVSLWLFYPHGTSSTKIPSPFSQPSLSGPFPINFAYQSPLQCHLLSEVLQSVRRLRMSCLSSVFLCHWFFTYSRHFSHSPLFPPLQTINKSECSLSLC